MTGNNVTYNYGTSGTSKGRPIHISDGTGSHELTYDALGNVTAETRIIVLPNSHEEFSLTMNYEYDSWGRMLSMTYPDGEEVSYTYQWGGDLSAMQSVMGVNTRTYIGQIQYNDYGQKSHVTYGNSASAEYSYDALHRLTNLKSRNGGGTLMQNINYTYDNASNVTGIANSTGVVNTLGGGYGNSYRYDALHRLVSSTGGGASTGTYDMEMSYTGSGRIKAKYRSSLSPTLSGTVKMYYGYCDEYQPHAVRRIYDEYNQKHYDFRWDASGNLGQVSYGNEDAQFESGRFMYWTEDSRMHVAVDDKHYSYYAYDYGGERRIKLTGDNSVLDVNADYMRTVSTLENVTLYPSAYMGLTDRGYTKHYYTGMERVAARIGDGGLDVGFYVSNTDSLHSRANRLYGQSLAQVNRRVLEANDVDCIMDGEMPVEELGIPFEAIPEQMLVTVGTEYGEFFGAMHLVSNVGGNSEVYYYHGDHLGSASWITDASGTAVQHLQYLPFGERFVDQRTSGYSERFTFTGKERDEETGYGYFGARYMDHELMTMWLSVDPMADKHPSISPYNYCMWNPIKLVDPDGNDTVKIHLDKGRFEHITSKGDHCIQFYRGKKLIEDETMTISRETCRITELPPQRLGHEQDGDIRVDCTQYLEFSHIASGEAVFRKIAELGAGRDLASMEWDYYELDNRGELSSSGLTDKMVHPADRYRSFKKMHHFHPFNEDESYYPSHSDQDAARRSSSSKCFLYSQGKSMEFGHLVPTDEGKYINMKTYAKIWRTFAN